MDDFSEQLSMYLSLFLLASFYVWSRLYAQADRMVTF